ncbi:TetR/AcrR family transcriptional regulator [Geothermobacter hydrogeniphilus]|uniref:TetR/AcrR family transcriptional regulator n=1 Tax=Geothermobacter hydrogeniphilus TaxID=1969733 RepID=A0A2K2HCP9_9BACT|nr:TetR/AcrR family transcriptional regulator [Geothermobacter hydrogeniphilus]PNU21076.1 TetR/AcrR family transcriptional regulator [Geothermobacter hydrogeniphilus]
MATKGEITKERLITEAARIIRRKGFTGTSVSDLIAATGIKKGSLYFHFSGKDELGLAVLGRSRDWFMEFFESSLTGDTPGECLSNFFDAVVSIHSKSGFVGGCIFGNTALEMSDGDERYAAFVDRFFAEMATKLEGFIAAAQDSGQVRADLPADTLALYIVMTLEGGIMLARLRKDEKPLRLCFDTLKVFLQLD